jgi:nucleoporin NUP82
VAVAHAFGVHLIDVRNWMRILFGAMQDEVTTRVGEKSKNAGCSEVTHLLDTFSVQQKSVLASKCDAEYELTVFNCTRVTSPVIGFCIVDNAMIGYSSVAVTSQYQAMPVELMMHPDHTEAQPAPPTSAFVPPKSPTSFFQASRIPSSPQRVSIKDKAYISLLEREPFDIPKFNSRRTAASLPPIASPSSPSVAPAFGTPQAPITPDALRSLGSRVEALRTDIRATTRGVNAVQARITLQHREMQRQLLKLAELQDQIAAHSSQSTGSRTNQLLIRAESVVEDQKALCRRLDHVLQRLMDVHASESETGLSEFEKAWFGELRRMRREVGGPEGGEEADSRSLWARAELVSVEFLSPLLSLILSSIIHSLSIISTYSNPRSRKSTRKN